MVQTQNQQSQSSQKKSLGKGKLIGWILENELRKGSIVLFLGFLISIVIAYRMKSLTGVGIMGIGILATMLIGANILSKEHDLTAGEVRMAITISSISVFFGLLAFGSSIEIEDKSLLKPLLANFWLVISTIIGFYFGGRSAEKMYETRMRTNNNFEDKLRAIQNSLEDTKKEIKDLKEKLPKNG